MRHVRTRTPPGVFRSSEIEPSCWWREYSNVGVCEAGGELPSRAPVKSSEIARRFVASRGRHKMRMRHCRRAGIGWAKERFNKKVARGCYPLSSGG